MATYLTGEGYSSAYNVLNLVGSMVLFKNLIVPIGPCSFSGTRGYVVIVELG